MSRYRAARGCDTVTVRHDTTLGAAIRAAQCTRVRGDRAKGACDMVGAGPRYSATAGHDTAQCALPGRNARGLCVQPGFRVCTWCTQPSFGLNALFQSLFRPLFMNTVHKFFSNKIK